MEEIYCYDSIDIKYKNSYITTVLLYSKNNEIYSIDEGNTGSYYDPTYEVTLCNSSLVEYKTIRSKEYSMTDKVESIFKRWADLEVRKKQTELLNSMIETVEQMNKANATYINSLDFILKHTLEVNDEVDWNKLKDKREFPTPKPVEPDFSLMFEPNYPLKNDHKVFPIKPNKDEYQYVPKFSFLDKISSKRKEDKIRTVENLFLNDILKWEEECKSIENTNKKIDSDFEQEIEKYNKQLLIYENKKQVIIDEYNKDVEKWENDKATFINNQNEYNKSVDGEKVLYNSGNPESIVKYNQLVLDNSYYPELVDKLFHVDFLENENTLIIDYLFPKMSKIPAVKEYKFIKSQNNYIEKKRSDNEINSLYENICFQISLRTIHEIFEADTNDFIRKTVFNGFVKEIDESIGALRERCILSVNAVKDDFLQINLDKIEPKICLKDALNGKFGSKLNKFIEIKPFIESTRNWRFNRGDD